MKSEDIQKAVKEVVLGVFENMYFMFAEVIGEDDLVPSLPKSWFKANVAVKNSPVAFTLYGSEHLVVEMAKNLLGTDQPLEEAELIDVFKESANVVAGGLVTRFALDTSVGLDVPVVDRFENRPELPSLPGAQEVVFDFEGELLKVVVVNSKE